MPARSTAKTRKTARRPARVAARGPALTGRQLLDRLAEIARIGSLFIEGEDCLDALTPAARLWTLADDINYDAAVAVPLKKNLLRIEKIQPFTYFAVLWRRRPDDPARVEVILAGRMNSAYDLGKGKCPPIFPALKQVFDKGRAATATVSDPTFEAVSGFRFGHVRVPPRDPLLKSAKRVVSHFEPIRDSREQVVAALELTCVVTG